MGKTFDEIKTMFGTTCTIIGENDASSICFPFRENSLSLVKNNVHYHIHVETALNRKQFVIKSTSATSFVFFLGLAMDIIRFENLFDGCFFPWISCDFDGFEGIDYSEMIKPYLLSYAYSPFSYGYIPYNYTNREYRSLYFQWKHMQKDIKFCHALFLYSTYSAGITADMRIAFFLEVFEPISELLYNTGKISLPKNPYFKTPHQCPHCLQTFEVSTRNRGLHFSDRVASIIATYGKDIFQGDAKKEIVQRATNTRNMVDHANAAKRNTLTGKQCGLYLRKFSLLYRYIILSQVGVEKSKLDISVKQITNSLNRSFPKCRIR